MTKTIFILFSFFSTIHFVYGQIENEWQPDSVYANKKVKKIFVYENSPKDLSEIIEFDKSGKKMRIENYDSSYNRRSRKLKRLHSVSIYNYDSHNLLTEIIDSILYPSGSTVNKTSFKYENSKLITKTHYKGEFQEPYSETAYSYKPFTSTTTLQNDSIITYQKIKEYDRDFYVNRFYGYSLESKLKKGQLNIDGVIKNYSYSDKTELQRFDDNKVIKNSFNEKGQLIRSEINSVFMTNRKAEYDLNYEYYENGLLKSIRGYVPRYYKYEFYQ